ncbi:IS110 family transposase [Micromonospora sp. KC606]|uniref:IS110 family transposase n=1 Tax=Micromonospora sp. KC606 TaxID=2530379 RepID=UPI001FB5A8B1|nr:IS110 family transposase [Micromonospora sp. KC606]
MGFLWAGVDVGKTYHHVCVVDDGGTVVLSEKIPNDQHAFSGIAGRLGKRRKPIRWAVDLRGGPASLLLAVLFDRGADVRYVSGTVTSRMAEAFHGERKTDAHDAYVIAQTLRMRGGLPTLTAADGVQQQLKLLLSRRLDLVADRVRITARIQDLLTMISPALEKALSLRSRGALRLLAQWQTPAGLRRAGRRPHPGLPTPASCLGRQGPHRQSPHRRADADRRRRGGGHRSRDRGPDGH